MLRLKAFGQPLVERDGKPLGGAARQRRVIALLTVIAAGRVRGVSRDRLLGLLWAEREPEKARQALTQSLYHARRALSQDDLFFAAADLRLNPDVISSDLDDFGTALERGDLAAAVALYQGPLLDGFHLNDAPEFERWMTEERAALHTRCARALEQLAIEAAAAEDLSGSAERWKQLAALEPLNSRIAMAAMRAMAQAGDRAGAVRYAEIHGTLLREQLDVAPHPAIAALADELRAEPVWEPRPDHQTKSRESSPTRAAPSGDAGIATSPPSRPSRPNWFKRGVVAGVGVILVVAVVIATRLTRAREPSRPPGDLIVVAPFRVSGADPSLAYLREGLVDLLVTSLGDDRSRIADPGAVLNAWRRTGSTDGGDLTRARAIEVARELGATRLLTGSVVGGPSRLVVNAAIVNVPGGAVRAQAAADGPADSLTTIVDRLVARLLVKEAGEWERLASHTSSSPQALREYLHGQAAYRRGSYDEAVRSFRRALERDASFAMAGLALATAAERIDATEERGRGLAAAWVARSDLTARDSIYLRALVGPRYPEASTPREFLSAWERAASVMGDRADVWNELGERLVYDGQALGIRDWVARATAAFRRAADLDPAFASPRQYLLQLGAIGHDTAAVRLAAAAYQRVDSTGEIAPFVRWRSAQALGDKSALAEIRRSIPRMPAASLRSIALSSQYNGIELTDADRAITALMSRAARGDDRADALLARHALALNEGRSAAALKAAQALAEDRQRATYATRLEVTDFLYGRGDSTAAARAAERLTRRLESSSERVLSPSQSSEVANNACVVRQWRLWLNATAPMDSATTLLLRGAASRDSSAGELCTALADAIEAAGAGTPDAPQRAARLDSLAQLGARDEELASYLGLALARVYVALGDNRRALDAVRRRPYMRRWPHYLAGHLELEGRVAAAVGDSAGAAEAYARYLTLRSDPDAAFRGEVADVRAALARLSERPDSVR